jgi:hypothetical protein
MCEVGSHGDPPPADPTYKRVTVRIEDLATGEVLEHLFSRVKDEEFVATPVYPEPDVYDLAETGAYYLHAAPEQLDVSLTFSAICAADDAPLVVVREID